MVQDRAILTMTDR